MPAEKVTPTVLSASHEAHTFEGIVQSRSSTADRYTVTVALQDVSVLCSCPSGRMRDAVCEHVKAVLDQFDADDFRDAIVAGRRIA